MKISSQRRERTVMKRILTALVTGAAIGTLVPATANTADARWVYVSGAVYHGPAHRRCGPSGRYWALPYSRWGYDGICHGWGYASWEYPVWGYSAHPGCRWGFPYGYYYPYTNYPYGFCYSYGPN